MRRSHRETFTTIKTEGALLPVEILQRIAEGDRDLEGLSPESYHLSKNEKLNEAINRAWNRCEGAWRSFQAAADTLLDSDAGTTLTRERWLLILFQELGYGRLLTLKGPQIDGKSYPISHSWYHTPVHLISFRQGIETRTPGVVGAARMSPHSMVQEFLNRSDDHLWGVVSNGLTLRLLRDNFSLTRQAYVEFDLQAMMSGEVYSDFTLLYMILHQSRVEAEKPEQCWLERWTEEAQRRGTRALDQLRRGVEEAIQTLGQGLIIHPANSSLRQKLQSGSLSPYGLYEQLLRLVYRLIFLFVAEDRDLLLGTDAPREARSRYMDHYSLTRIRRIAGRLRGTQHRDLWQGLNVTFRCLIDGEPALGLSPLGGFLFSVDALADLNDCHLSNDALLTAVRHLSYTQDRRMLRPVDYRNLGTEELGSVYESLLELHPEVNVSASTFELRVAAGSERKTTGSYYTPSSLIKCLLDSALEPVIATKLRKPDPEQALLELKVVDPACGSGHFLIAAAHRIGKHLAIVRTGEIEPPPEERRKALRDVVSHCIYGVDVNPLAVELCKVALWIETLDPGRPLGFLDHRIKCGNSLIGATPELLEKGIPDDAFKPVEGDDKKTASFIRKKNKEERKGQRDLFAPVEEKLGWQTAAEDFKAWGQLPEDAFGQVCEKVARYGTLIEKPAYQHEKQVADLWTAAFFWPLSESTVATVPTEDVFRKFEGENFELKLEMRERLQQLAEKYRFFHWHLEFPEVFSEGSPLLKRGVRGNFDKDAERGGFDCVLGNPPWERIKLQEKEFFAQRDPNIANIAVAAKRKRFIEKLLETNPSLWAELLEAKRTSECAGHFMRSSGRYPLNAVGDINTYQIFSGLATNLISMNGRAGIVIPSGIATDDSNKQFFSDLTEKRSLVSLYDFENREGIFPGVHRSYKFCLLTIGGSNVAPQGADFAFFLTNTAQMKDAQRHFSLSTEDIALLNPNTRTCPIFRTKRDAELCKGIRTRVPLWKSDRKANEDCRWEVEIRRVIDMNAQGQLLYSEDKLSTNCRRDEMGIFHGNRQRFLRLYEGKMIGIYHHRFADAYTVESGQRTGRAKVVRPNDLNDPGRHAICRFWVPEEAVVKKIPKWTRNWLVTYMDVCSVTNERTVIAAIIPWSAPTFSLRVISSLSATASEATCLLANLCSFSFDYYVRQFVGGLHLSDYIMFQMPVLPKQVYSSCCLWNRELTLMDWVSKRVVELSYTAVDLQEFAKDCGFHCYPYRWTDNRRFLLRCELDAAYFHLYSILREDLDYIMETFPIVKRKDEREYGEHRTKRVILECYDAMADAMKTGRPYQTILDPPPADPRVAYPPRETEVS